MSELVFPRSHPAGFLKVLDSAQALPSAAPHQLLVGTHCHTLPACHSHTRPAGQATAIVPISPEIQDLFHLGTRSPLGFGSKFLNLQPLTSRLWDILGVQPAYFPELTAPLFEEGDTPQLPSLPSFIIPLCPLYPSRSHTQVPTLTTNSAFSRHPTTLPLSHGPGAMSLPNQQTPLLDPLSSQTLASQYSIQS